MTKKVALITGITGQDGAYLADFLLDKGYEVHGIKRRSSLINTDRIDYLYQDPHEENVSFHLHYGDMTDSTNLIRIIQNVQPGEIYNLAAQSHVKVSFETPEYTANADAVGTLRLLEAIRILKLEEKTRFYQASTSELFGKVQETPQRETTPFYPRSPYAAAKLYAFWITVNYREAYNMFACNGILFNHESPLRGETFVTRKITRAAARIRLGLQKKMYLGNLDAKRDWGHAKDFVIGMWHILQQEKPDDYVLATGTTTEVREFAKMSFAEVGIEIEFSGSGIEEKGRVKRLVPGRLESLTAEGSLPVADIAFGVKEGDVVVEVDPRYFRPTEVDILIGDPTKAKEQLGWMTSYSLQDLIKDMIATDVRNTMRNVHLLNGGYTVAQYYE